MTVETLPGDQWPAIVAAAVKHQIRQLDTPVWLVWSNQKSMWWRANRSGYTPSSLRRPAATAPRKRGRSWPTPRSTASSPTTASTRSPGRRTPPSTSTPVLAPEVSGG